MTDFYENWLEYDYNPFILFDINGKIISLNQEAQFLLLQAQAKEIFSLATLYANISFGFKTTLLDFAFGEYKFYGLTVGYENENEIGIKLYKKPTKRFENINESIEKVNIYSLLDLCICTFSISKNIIFTKDFDPTFPDLKIDSNVLTKLLIKVYTSYENSSKINTKLAIKTGEYVKFNNKKYTIFYIEIDSDKRDVSQEFKIKTAALNISCTVSFTDTKTTLIFPMIF